MLNIKTVQTTLWAAFLAYYCYDKFFAAYQGYSHAYAIQVGLIVLATALLPFYLTRRAAQSWPRVEVPLLIVLPSLIALTGYAAFFLIFIAPNFPQVSALQVIPRGFISGIAISVILLLPVIAAAIRPDHTPAPDGRT